MGRQPVGVLQHAPGSESNLRHDIFRFKDSQTICAGGNFESQARLRKEHPSCREAFGPKNSAPSPTIGEREAAGRRSMHHGPGMCRSLESPMNN